MTEPLPRGIRPRGGKFFVDVTLRGRRRTGTASTLAEAKELQVQLKAAIIEGRDVGTNSVSKGWTLGKAFDRTAALEWAGTKGEKTALLNGNAAVTHFGRTMLLEDIDTNALDGWVIKLMERGNSNATINRKLAALSKVMTVAVDRKGLTRKPKMPKRKEPKGRTRFITHEEEKLIELTLARWGAVDLSESLVVLLDTGFRLGELLNIMPCDVTGNVITSWLNKGDDPRSIPMTKRVAEVIERRSRAVDKPTDKLFDFSSRWIQVQWDRVRHHLELGDVTLHVMRHTCASRLAQSGEVDLLVIQKWLGHKTITVTQRYAHLIPKNLADAAQVLERA